MRTISKFTAVVLGLVGVATLLFGRAGAEPKSRAEMTKHAEGLVLARCGVCHTTDLVIQQRLDRPRWQATVGKMIQWGAELSQEEAGILVEYLAMRFHPTTPDGVPLGDVETSEPLRADVTPVQGVPNGVAGRGAAVYAHNCQACHGPGASGGVGPKLAGNPVLRAETEFWDTVLHGRGPMPAWGTALSQQEIADIHAWLKTL